MTLLRHSSDTITTAIIGAAIEVHRTIGPGVLETTYNKCLRRELVLRNMSFVSEKAFPLEYKGCLLDHAYVIDLIVNDEVIVELKCVERLLPIHECQLLTYMRLQKIAAGLLINFKVPILKNGLKRILL
jgi:GxxExxY protein